MLLANAQSSLSRSFFMRAVPIFLAIVWGAGLIATIPAFGMPALVRLTAVAAILLAFAVSVVVRWLSLENFKERVGPFSPLPLMIGGFSLWAAASFFWSAAPLQTLAALATLSLLPGGFFVFTVMADNARFIRLTGVISSLVFGGLALWAVIQFLFFPDNLVSGQVRHPFANPNMYAATLSLGLFLASGSLFNSTSSIIKFCNLIIILLILWAIVLTGGRVVFLASIGFFGLFLWLNRQAITIGRRRQAVLAGLVFVLAVLAGAVLAQNLSGAVGANSLDRLMQIVRNPLWLIETRTLVWGGAWQIISSHFWLGTGYGTFYLFYPAYRAVEEYFTAGMMAHNDPLQFFAELGVVGPVLFYGIVVACLLRMKRFLNVRGVDGRVRINASLAFCALGVIVAHSHVSFDFYSAPLLLLFGSALGYWYAITTPVKITVSEGSAAPASKGAAEIALLGAFLMFCAGAFYVWQGTLFSMHYTSVARAALRAGELENYRLAVNAANRVGFGMNAQAYELAAMIPLEILEEERYAVYQKPLLIVQTEDLLERARKYNPRRPESYYYAARLESLTRNRDTALMQEALEKALALNPAHVLSRLLLAEIKAEQEGEAARWKVLEEGRHRHYIFNDPEPFYEALLQAAKVGGHGGLADEIVVEREKALNRYGQASGTRP